MIATWSSTRSIICSRGCGRLSRPKGRDLKNQQDGSDCLPVSEPAGRFTGRSLVDNLLRNQDSRRGRYLDGWHYLFAPLLHCDNASPVVPGLVANFGAWFTNLRPPADPEAVTS